MLVAIALENLPSTPLCHSTQTPVLVDFRDSQHDIAKCPKGSLRNRGIR